MHFNALIPELAVTDCAKSLHFYCQVLGFEIAYQRSEEDFVFLTLGSAQIMLDQIGKGRTFLADGDSRPSTSGYGVNFQIMVDALDPLLKNLAKSKIALFLEPEEKWYRQGKNELGQRQFIVADPDGYLLRFGQDIGQRIYDN